MITLPKTKLLTAFIMVITILLAETTLPAYAVGDAFFSFSPASGSYHVGDTINFAISETSTSSDNVNAVEADLTYNASQLQYVSTSLTGPFTICANNSGGGGSVSLACASSSVVSGTQKVATVSFKVLTTGTATITLANTSNIDSNTGSSVWDTTLPSASYSLSQAVSSSSSSSSGGGGSSSNNNNSCSAQAPTSAPNLYEIDVTNTTATLYFSPPGDPYNSFYISFGNGNNSEGYGAQFSTGHSTGALYYTVRQLTPSSVYTFKVRGANGCQPGPWSNTLTILTNPRYSTYTKKYYEYQQAPIIQSTVTSWYQKTAYYVADHYGVALPGAPDTGLAAPSNPPPTKEHVKFTPAKPLHTAAVVQKPHQSSSLWGSIVHFVTGIFHF